MTHLRTLVVLLFATLAIYTLLVIPQHGVNFIPGFVGDLMALDWRGQVNLDFITYLVLSALWVVWRHRFSTLGMVVAMAVMVGAMILFAPYLLYAMYRAKGDIKALLLGENI